MKSILHKAFGVMLITLFANQLVLAQGNTLKLNGNNNFDATSKVGATNNADVKIITRDSTRVTVTKQGNVVVEKDLKVKGKVSSDSVVHFVNNVTIDSSLEVRGETVGFTNGGGSFWWKPNFTTPILQDLLSVSTGYFTVMGGGKKNITPLIGMGINTQTPKAILHINDANSTYLQITNNATGMASTADGFRVGIDATGIAEVRQLENSPLLFFTNNIERMRIGSNGNIGINTLANANNKLVINSGIIGESGLTLFLMGSGSIPSPPNGKVLSVDVFGKVILVNSIGGGNVNTCISPGPIVNYVPVWSTTTELCNSQIYNSATQVLMGLTNPPFPIFSGSKLEVWNNNPGARYGIVGTVTGSAPALSQTGVFGIMLSGQHGQSNTAVQGQVFCDVGASFNSAFKGQVTGAGQNMPPSSITQNTGLDVIAYGNTATYAAGVLATAQEATVNWGGFFTADATNSIFPPPNTSFLNTITYGINAIGKGAKFNTGGYFVGDASPGLSTQNIGVYAQADHATSYNCSGQFIIPSPVFATTNYAIYAQAPSGAGRAAGYFNGDIAGIGIFSFTSDSMLKENNAPFNGLNLVRQLNPNTFNFKTSEFPALSLSAGTHYGFTAQEVETVIPQLVKTATQPEMHDTLGNTTSSRIDFKTLNYIEVIPIAIGAIKQLDSTLTKATSVPNAPVLISPADGASGNFGKGQLTWHSVSQGIVLYHAQIAKDNTFSNLVLDNNGITDTTTFFSVCDTIPTTFYWRVNAKNNAGTGAWSQVFSFTDTAKCLKDITPIRRETAVSFSSSSDSRLKTNVTPVTSALDKVNALNGIYYNWVQTPGYEFDSGHQIGVIAQDVQSVIPEVVHTDVNGFYSVDYGRLVPVLIEAIKEQQAQILALQGGGSKTTGNNNLPSTDAELASENSILWQNFPNPFGDGTIIRYFVTEKSANASMIFYDEFGNKIKNIELPHKGENAELNLSTSNLASGIYSYSLVVDGKIVATKNMIKTK
ncbi:MAG: tail fiber domain-containing protein [Bacteroidetes bacterium]|nr:tail fiber domain-containing protein [Bacteroidota bacterium]